MKPLLLILTLLIAVQANAGSKKKGSSFSPDSETMFDPKFESKELMEELMKSFAPKLAPKPAKKGELESTEADVQVADKKPVDLKIKQFMKEFGMEDMDLRGPDLTPSTRPNPAPKKSDLQSTDAADASA